MRLNYQIVSDVINYFGIQIGIPILENSLPPFTQIRS
jgi:hypothetical protein